MDNLEKQFDALLAAYMTELAATKEAIELFDKNARRTWAEGKWHVSQMMDGYRCQADNDRKKLEKIIGGLKSVRTLA